MFRKQVTSSNLRSVGYDPDGPTLEIEFRDGSVYQYHSVPSSIHEQLMVASSKGGFFRDFIRDQYPTIKVR